MAKAIKVTLYHATWCPACVKFKPNWNKFKDGITNINNKHKDIKMSVEEYEHEELEKMGGGKLNGKDIEGYPTIKVGLTCGKISKEYDYDNFGKRKAEYMMSFVDNLCKELKRSESIN
jgi:thiol-disulfide isomerase/thioredoxin